MSFNRVGLEAVASVVAAEVLVVVARRGGGKYATLHENAKTLVLSTLDG